MERIQVHNNRDSEERTSENEKDMSILEIKRELDMKPYLMEFMKAVIELNDEERKQLLTIMQKGE
ncbi:MAG: hypothetical protein ACLUUO_11230 [Sellimonas intestinalis]